MLTSSLLVSLPEISESILKLDRLLVKDEFMLELSLEALAALARTRALSNYWEKVTNSKYLLSF